MAGGETLNFAGYVPVRRGISGHLVTGHLTLLEWAVMHVLLLLADSGTGMGYINSPLLHYYLRDLSLAGAKRTLLSLEEKGYIFRKITPHARHAYPFWIDRYYITSGRKAHSRVDLSDVFASKDIKDIKYGPGDPETRPDGEPVGEPVSGPEGVHSNKKEKEKDKENSHTH